MSSLVLPPGAFRLLLALAVLLSHISNFDVGRLAVLLFFYLSGYWIASIWATKFGPGSAGRFYLSRFLRIWPLFLLVTLASAWLRGSDLGLTNFTLLGLAATGEASDPTTVSWSLDIELQFYLLAPFLLALLNRHAVLTLAVATALVALGWWLDAAYAGLTVLKFLPAFLLGSLTYAHRWRPSYSVVSAGLLLFAAVTAYTAYTGMLWKSEPKAFDRDVYGLLWMLPMLPYVARSLTVKSGKVDRDLGNLSFPLYLVHPAVIYALGALGVGAAGKGLVLFVSLLAAVAIYYTLDRPLDRARVRLTENSGRSPASKAA